jgi:hypothetical protein
MVNFPLRMRRQALISNIKRSPIFWTSLAILLSVLILGLIFFSGGKSQKPGQIPPEVLSKIDQEKARMQKEFAQFIETPAGTLWQKHPYWDPATCQKIIEGQLFPGMTKEQVREAVSRVIEVRRKKEEKPIEEWVVESKGKEKTILKFEGNALASIEK